MAEQIIAEYKLKVDEAVKNLNKVQSETKELDADLKKTGKDGQRSMDEIGKSAGGLSSVMKKLGGVIAAAFAVDRIIAFGKEAVRLAAQAEGIERAFRKLNNPNLLADLRRATRGTVTDLELMRSAVRANNFQIPLEKLATFFEFATKRSIETGESVDYLVNSIVDGIGRKSTLVLDNLGISAAQLQEEIKKTGDFGVAAANIIEQSLEQTGEVADTTAIKISKISTAFENLQKKSGELFILLLEDIASALERINYTSRELSKDNALSDAFKEGSENARNTIKNIEGLTDSEEKRRRMVEWNLNFYSKAYDEEQEKIGELVAEQESLEGQTSSIARKRRSDIIKELQALDELSEGYLAKIDVFQSYIDALDKGGDKTETYVRSIATLNAELKTLKEQFEKAEIGGVDFYRIADEIEAKIKEINLALRLLAERKYATQPDEEIAPFNITEIESQELTTDAIIDDYERRNKEIEKLIKERNQFEAEQAQKRREEELNQWTMYANSVSSIVSSLSQIQQSLNEQQIDALRVQFEEGQITREEYDEKRKEILRNQAEDQKALAIFDASINGFAAVVNAYNTDPTGVLAGITAAIVAAQIAAIAAQPIPEFATGVIDLKGKGTETSDSIPAKLSRGESVMTAKETRKYKDELMAIRNGTFENLIFSKYIKPMVDESLLNGFRDMGRSAELNGITANLKDHNILAGLDRLRQSQNQGFRFLAQEQKKLFMNQSRGGYRA